MKKEFSCRDCRNYAHCQSTRLRLQPDEFAKTLAAVCEDFLVDPPLHAHDFEVGVGGRELNGKRFYPDCLNLDIPGHMLYSLLQQVSSAIEQGSPLLTLSYVGKLSYDVDEDE